MIKEFWKSKTFYTAIFGFIAVIANGAFNFEIPNEVIVGIMAILAIIFRWNADSKLTVKKLNE